jgi:hypothetical protein
MAGSYNKIFYRQNSIIMPRVYYRLRSNVPTTRNKSRGLRSNSSFEGVKSSRRRKGTRNPSLIKNGELTVAGKSAANNGEREYEQLIDSFGGYSHLSQGRPAAVKARIALKGSNSKFNADIPIDRSSSLAPMANNVVITSMTTTYTKATKVSTSSVRTRSTVQLRGAKINKTRCSLTTSRSSIDTKASNPKDELGGNVHQIQSKQANAQKRKIESNCKSHNNKILKPNRRKRKNKQVKVPLKRIRQLAARYKSNHDEFSSVTYTEEIEEGEYEIEQILCSDGTCAQVLVKWALYPLPTWEPVDAMLTTSISLYQDQGIVSLVEYVALLDSATSSSQ